MEYDFLIEGKRLDTWKANELFGKDWDELKKKVTKKLQNNAPHIYGMDYLKWNMKIK
jgi:hypothetical protein